MSREPDNFLANNPTERPAVEALNNLFRYAVQRGVADVHLHEVSGQLAVRIRHPGGSLIPIEFPPGFAQPVDTKIRARARMSLSDHIAILDGRMRLTFPEIPAALDVRVSIAPTVNGQKTVCRILDQAHSSWTFADLGVDPMIRESLVEVAESPNGLFIVTGPTGSGKTTTLYALVNHLDDDTRNIVTVENPVEYVLPRLTQINIDHLHISFASALRGVLRQDPDVILVGEIRDPETAKIAVDASVTGHLVLATMHANNAADVPRRLIELGVDPVTLASAVRGFTAQRLVRTFNTEVSMGQPNEVERQWLLAHEVPMACYDFPTGVSARDFSGNAPIVEFIRCDQGVRTAIGNGGAANEILAAVRNQPQYESLAYAGTKMASLGKTTLAEVRRVVGEEAGHAAARRLGHYLLAHGVVTVGQLAAAVEQQWNHRHEGRVVSLGAVLLEAGVCALKDIETAMAALRSDQGGEA